MNIKLYANNFNMKSQLRNCAVSRPTRHTKLTTQFDNNKENICTDWHLDRLVACRLGKINLTPTTMQPSKQKNLPYHNNKYTLP
jgi:hypothetical protein